MESARRSAWRPAGINTRTVADLDRVIRANLHKLPTDLSLVVGIPRSGMLPAGLIASYLNVPLTDLSGLLAGHLGGTGFRHLKADSKEKKGILLVDDSIASGNEMRRVKAQIETARLECKEMYYLAVFGEAQSEGECDFVLESVPFPRIFSWNAVNSWVVQVACVDIDGLLCHDPSEEQNDDGPAYLEFLQTAPALYSCRYKIKHLVTSRLEKYRSATEEWCAKNGIEFENLHMVDLPSAKDRTLQGPQFHAIQKARVYKSLPETCLFLESAKWQAELISKYSGKSVLSIENGLFYHPNKQALRKSQIEHYMKYPRAFAGLIARRIIFKALHCLK
jgi:uncharacterized HAD superfamily protein/orotate phosphoribosyltransferase